LPVDNDHVIDEGMKRRQVGLLLIALSAVCAFRVWVAVGGRGYSYNVTLLALALAAGLFALGMMKLFNWPPS
jgi:hypothetical protein